LTIEQHEIICGRNRDAILNWAHQVADTSEKDRNGLHEKVDELKGIIPRFQWWFIGILVAIIISSYLMPKLTSNGTHETLKEMKNTLNIVVDKQAKLDTILGEVREDQQRRGR
jgi:hypothetical protein